MKLVGMPAVFLGRMKDTKDTEIVSRKNINTHVSFSGSKYKSPNATTDVVQFSQKSRAINKLLKNKDYIAELRRNGVSQEEIARRFNVRRFEVAEFLEIYLPDVQRDDAVFRNAVKNYLSANSEVERNQAFEEVDKVLQKVAANKTQTQNGVIYKDCLQDLRLKFLESVKQTQGKYRIIYTQILQDLKNSDNSILENDYVPYEQNRDTRQSDDENIANFEHNDVLKYLMDNSGLNTRQRYIIYSYLIAGKSLKEIGNLLGRTDENIRHNLNKAEEKMNKEYTKISSDEYLNRQLNLASERMRKILDENENI